LLNLDRNKLVPRDFGYCLENRLSSSLLPIWAPMWSVIALIAATICRRLFLEIVGTHEGPRGLQGYHPARKTGIADLDAPLAVTPEFSSRASSKIFCIPISTRVDPTGFLHKHLQPRSRHLATSDVPQRARPFADRLVIDSIFGRAANDGSKRIRIPVEEQLRKFECVSQKLLNFSPHFVMSNDCKHGFQISVHGIASTTGLEPVPHIADLFKPSSNPSARSAA
jgi:hypothetical protein